MNATDGPYPEALKAMVQTGGQVVVKDTSDGLSTWTPDDSAAAEIAAARDPKAKAIEICDREPMRGAWSN